ncbi:ankyrin repeat-containing protein [Penicillium coprophilum]|uniref:ankyrin repeat-containing protein n=1 Tax=Penicillium coprophilum TaxID=36646 RepID=UPI00239A8CEF|nr:ankyrin repeat-containing protein [Penicillium coprophilum]KAJ5153938.1 ankyrin repeat-containing protein [Penicillium coprophilum]
MLERGTDLRARDTFRETPFHSAARGIVNDHVCRDGRDKEVTTENKIKLQDEMMRVLKKAAGKDTAILMSQTNAEASEEAEVEAEANQ